MNLAFVGEHCHTDAHVKAVICHEFLHVLLRHTERFTDPDAGRAPGARRGHQRDHPPQPRAGLQRDDEPLLRRGAWDRQAAAAADRSRNRTRIEHADWGTWPAARNGRCRSAWGGLYAGKLVADDIRDLAREHLDAEDPPDGGRCLATTTRWAVSRSPARRRVDRLADALDTALKAMNGSGVFRSPTGRGVGADAYRNEVRAADTAVDRWRRETYAVLRRHLLPDPRSVAREPSPRSFTLPVLSPGDRRAALRSLWSPFLPDARWETEHTARAGSAHVYLDVSGSMNAEMPLIVALLGRLTPYIRRPFWAFSNVVAPARIEQGRLIADTTGGTSMGCVLDHVARTRPKAAIVVTDGYIEPIAPAQVAATAGTRLHVIVTRDGSATLLRRAGLPYTQLSRLPS